MAVTVVSSGPVRTRRVICVKCCYELEYTGEDVQAVVSRDYTGSTDTEYYVECPRCKHKSVVPYWQRPV